MFVVLHSDLIWAKMPPMFNKSQLDAIDELIDSRLMGSGIDCVILMNQAGNTIAEHNIGNTDVDVKAFAALAAGNFAAVDAMAKLVGESEFALLFHKGEKVNVHFSKVNHEMFIITMFNKQITLGLVRLKVDEVVNSILETGN